MFPLVFVLIYIFGLIHICQGVGKWIYDLVIEIETLLCMKAMSYMLPLLGLSPKVVGNSVGFFEVGEEGTCKISCSIFHWGQVEGFVPPPS